MQNNRQKKVFHKKTLYKIEKKYKNVYKTSLFLVKQPKMQKKKEEIF